MLYTLLGINEHFGTNDIICCVIWCHLSFLPHQFSIFDDVGGWEPCIHSKAGILNMNCFCAIYVARNQRALWHKWHHLLCDMMSSIISSPSILNIWWRGGLRALHSLKGWDTKLTTEKWSIIILVELHVNLRFTLSFAVCTNCTCNSQFPRMPCSNL